jgi:lantibiotic modifying enzyme
LADVAETIAEHHFRNQAFPVEVAEQLGQAFGSYHRKAGNQPTALSRWLYSGAMGVAWSLIRAADLLDATECQERGLALLADLGRLTTGVGLDVMAGYAGAIPVLPEISRRFARPAWVGLASSWGDRLEQVAVKAPEGWSSKPSTCRGRAPIGT